MRYQKRVIHYEPIDIDESELMTVADAARYLGISTQSVTIRAQKGLMTLIEDTQAPNPQRERTLVLRTEVEEWARQRAANPKSVSE